ncbi:MULTISPECIES: methyltransferase domain-containing protein [unclassified Bradyrhizobium]|uniref:methyltransferase domain-containing protein n=1 Tax=unclassified Bradyrhizobium TaxID=2631580 RepID=UPI00247A218C|nr:MULTISPECIES: methyltransferase domain-containing protein [unclassified Bradyrhizobium]WGR74348.1 methyltransferase domain-containing protein [Bradyrhizobium sp. ISRA426]WGR79183.1 methyltransferase domain-containing protein [Bradyrhizobium sp. ISRA430]WGR90604.1 methyltransferase domain-containing protein [Bradyrhizobium sp. ISRA432]
MEMRDVVTGFYVDVLERLVDKGVVSKSDSVLVVCGGPLDEKVMAMVGFGQVTVTNLDDTMSSNFQDAENLTYQNDSFDLVVVHAGLHHCYSPHRALLEMYRVARKCAVAFEARDSLMIRTAVRFGLTEDYETHAIRMNNGLGGGVANGPVPNFIYRWTEDEVRKAVASFDPAHAPTVSFFYDLRIPVQRFTQAGNRLMRAFALAIEPASRLFARLLPKQCNEFAFAVVKANELQPWMETAVRMRLDKKRGDRTPNPILSDAEFEKWEENGRIW